MKNLVKHTIKVNDLKHFVKDDKSCIELKKKCTRHFQLFPGQLNNIKKCMKEHLNLLTSTYDCQLDGIILNFKNIKIKPLVYLAEDANINVDYISDVYVFRPQEDKILKGIVNKKSEDHIGCLVHEYFNATISRPKEINLDNWEGKHFNIGDEIVFRVLEAKLERRLPYIRGCLIENDAVLKSEEVTLNETNTFIGQTLTPASLSPNKSTKIIEPLKRSLSSLKTDLPVSKKRKRSPIKESSTSNEIFS